MAIRPLIFKLKALSMNVSEAGQHHLDGRCGHTQHQAKPRRRQLTSPPLILAVVHHEDHGILPSSQAAGLADESLEAAHGTHPSFPAAAPPVASPLHLHPAVPLQATAAVRRVSLPSSRPAVPLQATAAVRRVSLPPSRPAVPLQAEIRALDKDTEKLSPTATGSKSRTAGKSRPGKRKA